MKSLLANILIALGIILFITAGLLLWQRYNPQRLTFKNVSEATFVNSGGSLSLPQILEIEELDIKLPVISQKYSSGRWETTTKGVSYLANSTVPGEVGNSVFYGHNYKNILGNLKNAKPGQIIEIVFTNGEKRRFRIEFVQVVSANQTGILDKTEDTRLTVYTCTGFLDRQRLVVTAFLQEGPDESI